MKQCDLCGSPSDKGAKITLDSGVCLWYCKPCALAAVQSQSGGGGGGSSEAPLRPWKRRLNETQHGMAGSITFASNVLSEPLSGEQHGRALPVVLGEAVEFAGEFLGPDADCLLKFSCPSGSDDPAPWLCTIVSQENLDLFFALGLSILYVCASDNETLVESPLLPESPWVEYWSEESGERYFHRQDTDETSWGPFDPDFELPAPVPFLSGEAPDVDMDLGEPAVQPDVGPKLTMRERTAMEFVQTERDYVRDLGAVRELFLEPLLAKNSSIGADDCASLFSNWQQLTMVNQQIVDRFDELGDQAGENLGAVFCQLAPFLKVYSQFCADQDRSMATLTRLQASNKKFVSFLRYTEARPESRGLTLNSFLIKPLQRVCKYPLLFRELLKHTDAAHPDRALIEQASVKIGEIVATVNESKRDSESAQLFFDLQQLEGADQFTIVSPSRKLLRKGEIMCAVGKEKKKEAQYYLCNDAVILQRKGKQKLVAFVSFATCLVRAAADAAAELELVDVQAKRMVRLITPSADEAAKLSQEIEQLIETTLSQGYKEYLDDLEAVQEEDARMEAEHAAQVEAEKREIEKSKKWLQDQKQKQDQEKLDAARAKPATLKAPGSRSNTQSSMSFEEWKRQRAKPLPKPPKPVPKKLNFSASKSGGGVGGRSQSGSLSPRPVHTVNAAKGWNKPGLSSNSRRCEKCKDPLNSGARFCAGCGTPVSAQAGGSSSSSKNIGGGGNQNPAAMARSSLSSAAPVPASSPSSRRSFGWGGASRSSGSGDKDKDAEKEARKEKERREKEEKKKEKEQLKKAKDEAKAQEKRRKEEEKKQRDALGRQKKEEAKAREAEMKRVRDEEKRKRDALREKARPPPAAPVSSRSSGSTVVGAKLREAVSSAKQTVASALPSSSSSSDKCGKCNNKFASAALKFCTKCGERRGSSSSSTSQSKAKAAPRVCGGCGTVAQGTGKFCRQCGKPVDTGGGGGGGGGASPSKSSSFFSSSKSSPKASSPSVTKKWGAASTTTTKSSSPTVTKKWGGSAGGASSSPSSSSSSFVKNAAPPSSGTGKCPKCKSWRVGGVCKNCG